MHPLISNVSHEVVITVAIHVSQGFAAPGDAILAIDERDRIIGTPGSIAIIKTDQVVGWICGRSGKCRGKISVAIVVDVTDAMD